MAIKQLTEFQHMQSKPEMYIGQTQSPIHLLYEIIDNAADESINGKADVIKVVLDYDKFSYSVEDNGRGIPIESPNIEQECPIVIATTLYSGGKFDNELYSYHSGLHGVGLAVINALSEQMTIIVRKNKKFHRKYDFYNSESQDITPVDIDRCNFSTKVSFIPSSKYFDTLAIDREEIVNRLKGILISSEKPIKIFLETVKNREVEIVEIYNDLIEEFETNLDDFFECSITGKRTAEDTVIEDRMKLYIGYSTKVKHSKFSSVINTLPISEGKHKKFVENALKNFMYERAQKLKKHVEKEDMLLGSNIFAILSLSDPAFSGQMKNALEGKNERYDHLFSIDSLYKIFNKNLHFFDDWIEYCESYRIKMDSERKLKAKRTKSTVSVEDLKDCTSKNIEERELYLLEGQSAGGTLLQARDPKIHAILPLRGKILNVLNANFSRIVESKALAGIFNTLGIKPNFEDIENLRYGKIIIMCDGDPDGLHLSALLISFFDKYAKSAIKCGKLYVAKMPLFGCTIKKKFIPIFNEEDLAKYRDMGAYIHRYKGLGEMDPEELATCAFNETTRHLIRVDTSSESIAEVWENKLDIVKNYLF